MSLLIYMKNTLCPNILKWESPPLPPYNQSERFTGPVGRVGWNLDAAQMWTELDGSLYRKMAKIDFQEL